MSEQQSFSRERWFSERGLKLEWAVTIDNSWLPGHFYFVQHDRDGAPHLNWSTSRGPNGYSCPTGIRVPYCPQPDSFARWKASKRKVLAEGQGKTIALHGLGLDVIGFGGAEAWHRGDLDSDGIGHVTREKDDPAYWNFHPWYLDGFSKGDSVEIVPDGDWRTNPGVRRGMERALAEGRAIKINVSVVDISGAPVRTGIDDLIKCWRDQGLDPLAEYLALPRLKYLIDWPDPIDVFSTPVVSALRHEYLPPTLANYVFDQADLIGVDPGSIALPCISALSSLIPDTFKVQVVAGTKWHERACCWSALVSPPSAKKTPSINAAIAPVWELNKERVEAWQFARAEHNMRLKLDKDNAGPEPKCIRHIATDTTIEALSEVLENSPNGILVYRDELASWLAAMGQYSNTSKGDAERGDWLEGYNGGPRTIDRIQRGLHKLVHNWGFVVVGGIQPERLRKTFPTLGDDGLLQRFMINLGTSRPRVERPMNAIADQAYRNVCRKLATLVPDKPNGQPQIFLFAPDADVIRKEVFDWVSSLVASLENISTEFATHVGKWEALFVRLCLTFELVEHPEAKQITAPTAERVASFMQEYLFSHLSAFYESYGGAEGDTGTLTSDVRKVAEHLIGKAPEEITVGWLLENVKRIRHKNPRQKEEILGLLVELRWLEPVQVEQRGAGRPFAGLWAVNPKIAGAYGERRASIERGMRAIAKQWKRGDRGN